MGFRVQVVGMVLCFVRIDLLRLFAAPLHRVGNIGPFDKRWRGRFAGALLAFRGGVFALVLLDRFAVTVARHPNVDGFAGTRAHRVGVRDFDELRERDEFPRVRVPTHPEVDLARAQEPAQGAADLRWFLEAGPEVDQDRFAESGAFAVVRVAGGRDDFQRRLLLRELRREGPIHRVDDVRDRLLAPRWDIGVGRVASSGGQPLEPVAPEQEEDRLRPRLIEARVVIVLDGEAGEAVEAAQIFFAFLWRRWRRHERGFGERVPAAVVRVSRASGGGHARTVERVRRSGKQSVREMGGFCHPFT